MIILVTLILLIIVCIFTDLKYQKVYNHITFPAIILGLGFNWTLYGWVGLCNSLLGFMIGFGLFFFVFCFGGMGGGDVKLMGAIGALKGYHFVIEALLYSALAGGVIAIGVMIWHKTLCRGLRRIFRTIYTFIVPWLVTEPLKKEESHKIPYSVAIGIGSLWALLMEKVGYEIISF